MEINGKIAPIPIAYKIAPKIIATIVAGFIGSLLYFIIKGFRKKITEQGRIQNEYSALYIKCINQSKHRDQDKRKNNYTTRINKLR